MEETKLCPKVDSPVAALPTQDNKAYTESKAGSGTGQPLEMESGVTVIDGATQPSVKMKTEDILDRLGGFSYFQFFATLVLISPEISSAMISLSPVLTMSSHVEYYCRHPNSNSTKNSDSGTVQENPSYFQSLIGGATWRQQSSSSSNSSGNDKTSFDVTHLCDVNNQFDGLNHSDCPDGTMLPSFPYTSIVQEFELLCKRDWIPDSLTSLQMLGSMLGAFVSGVLSDRFGRRPIFFILIFLMSLFNFLGGLATDLYTFVAARFIAGFAVGGCFVVYINYLMEFLTPQYRAVCGCVSLWGVGEMFLALLGYCVGGWRTLSWVTSLPLCLIFLAYKKLPESPRWLLCQRRTAEAKKVFDQIARWNGRPALEEWEVYKLQETILLEKSQNNSDLIGKGLAASQTQTQTTIPTPVQEGLLVKVKQFLKRESTYWRPLLIFSFLWFSSSLVYYGISFNMKNLEGDLHLKIFFMGLADLFGMLLSFFVSLRCGRKRSCIGFLLSTAAFLFAVILVSEWKSSLESTLYYQLMTCLCLWGRFFNSAGYAIMACYTAESFATPHRASSMSICSFMGYVGAIAAPQIAYLTTMNSSLPYFVFGALAALSSCASLFLDEMNGETLKDS